MKYFIIENKQQQGPFSIYELKDKGISSDTPVWAEGMNDWTPAGKVDELKDFLFNTNDKSTPPPYIPPKLTDTSETEEPKSSNHYGCLIFTGIILLGIIVFLAITNPDKQQHKEAIQDKIVLALDKQTTNNNSIVGLGVHLVGKMFVNQVSDRILDEMLNYHNYGLFSTCSVNLKGKAHTVSYGLVSLVFTANDDDIAKYLDENLPSVKDVLKIPEINFDKDNDKAPNEATATPKDTTNTNESDLGKDIQEELVNSMGRLIKKEVGRNTDSATSENIGKIIDDIIDLIQ